MPHIFAEPTARLLQELTWPRFWRSHQHGFARGREFFAIASIDWAVIFPMYMAQIFTLRGLSTSSLNRRRSRLIRELRLPPNIIRASVVERFHTCGKPNCACGRGQKHGPFYFLTQCLAVGRIQKFLLKSPVDRQAARAATAAFNHFYDGLEELSQINTELLRRGESIGG